MSRLAALAAIPVAGCMPPAGEPPQQDAAQILTVFGDAIRGCTAGVMPTGSVDQAAMAATGWRVTKRTAELDLEVRSFPLDDYPQLRPREYEVTDWTHDGYPNGLSLTRRDGSGLLVDYCDVAAQGKGKAGADAVVAGISSHFGHGPDRKGTLPRGGDFMAPKSGPPNIGYYWAMPHNDVYLTASEDGFVRLSVLAMADRAKLNTISPDRPEYRIPLGDSPK